MPKPAQLESTLRLKLLVLPENVRLVWKWLAMMNVLTYSFILFIGTFKSFRVKVPVKIPLKNNFNKMCFELFYFSKKEKVLNKLNSIKFSKNKKVRPPATIK
jgi:hypothetical protein